MHEKAIITIDDTNIINAEEAKASSFEGIKRIAQSSHSPDLMFVHFILLHEGGNDNGDYFLRDEVEQVWPSYVGKPITWEHDQPYIGHITDARLVKPEGDSPDPRWYIECAGIIWKARYPELAANVADGAHNGTYKMSMEVYFQDALYMLGDNENKLYTAEEAPYLVKLKGRTYQGEKVWRVLLGCIGGGAGVVRYPADQDALILNVAKRQKEENASKNEDIYVNYEQCVAHLTVSDIEKLVPEGDASGNNVDKEVKEQMNELERAQATITKLEDKVDNLEDKIENLETEKANLESAKAELEEAVARLEAELAEAKEALESVQAEFAEYKEQIEHEKAEAAKDKLAETRISELKEAGVKVTEAKADKWFNRLREMDDEAYADFKDMLLDNVSNEDEEEEAPSAKAGSEQEEQEPAGITTGGRRREGSLNLEDEAVASLKDKAVKFWERSLSGKSFYRED